MSDSICWQPYQAHYQIEEHIFDQHSIPSESSIYNETNPSRAEYMKGMRSLAKTAINWSMFEMYVSSYINKDDCSCFNSEKIESAKSRASSLFINMELIFNRSRIWKF